MTTVMDQLTAKAFAVIGLTRVAVDDDRGMISRRRADIDTILHGLTHDELLIVAREVIWNLGSDLHQAQPDRPTALSWLGGPHAPEGKTR